MGMQEKFSIRRPRSFDEHYSKLSGAQISTIYALTQMGYALYFVRMVSQVLPYAVLKYDQAIVGVDHQGNVDFAPKLELRD
ncbi:MAG: hypothetical protein AseanaTS_04520 [Candidatus Pelagadaptatus aseana]|uniref:hypothetical protein n=1 Tax=Candidatus Pelagadaptatus aseana TaxID=3120508 RepID=UPI0039B18169